MLLHMRTSAEHSQAALCPLPVVQSLFQQDFYSKHLIEIRLGNFFPNLSQKDFDTELGVVALEATRGKK